MHGCEEAQDLRGSFPKRPRSASEAQMPLCLVDVQQPTTATSKRRTSDTRLTTLAIPPIPIPPPVTTTQDVLQPHTPPAKRRKSPFRVHFPSRLTKKGRKERDEQAEMEAERYRAIYGRRRSLWTQIQERYAIGKLLGRGNAGKVYYAIDRETNTEVAVKIMKYDWETPPSGNDALLHAAALGQGRHVLDDDDARTKFLKEYSLLDSFQHEGIIKLYDIFDDGGRGFAFIMQYAPKGDMTHFIRSRHKKRFSEKEAMKILKKLLVTVNFLHQHGVIHRDIKPENILFDEKENPLLCDFSLATTWSPGRKRDSVCGTLHYASPEILAGEYVGPEVDVWSLGAVAYYMLTGKSPFENSSDLQVMLNIRKGKRSPLRGVSEECKEMINQMMDANPMMRPSIGEILMMPCFSGSQIQRTNRRGFADVSSSSESQNSDEDVDGDVADVSMDEDGDLEEELEREEEKQRKRVEKW